MSKSIIFYGAGRHAKKNLKRWLAEGYEVVCFCDADKNKQHTLFPDNVGGGEKQFQVWPLSEAILKYPDYELWITVERTGVLPIVSYLREQNIPEDRIKEFPITELGPQMTLREIQDEVDKNNWYGKRVADIISEKYDVLWDFAETLTNNANFSSIEITDGKIIASLRQYPVRYYITRGYYNSIVACCASVMEYDMFTSKMVQLFLGKSCIIDIGGNIGFYTCLAGKLNPKAQIHSFEPIPETYEILNLNIKLNRLDNIYANCVALSDSLEAEAVMYYSKYDDGSQSLAQTRDDGTKQEVAVVLDTLDGYVDRHNLSPDFIKIDVEGHELHVLKGAEKTLRKYKPVIIAETEPRWLRAFGDTGQDVFDFLSDIGYSIYKICETELTEVSNVFPVYNESNYVFMVE